MIKSTAIVLGFVALTALAGGVEAKASIDPMAKEVAIQTWYNDIPQAKRMHYCDTRNAKAIVRKHNPEATPAGKKQLRKAYRYILSNC
jgi:hypothetical protein